MDSVHFNKSNPYRIAHGFCSTVYTMFRLRVSTESFISTVFTDWRTFQKCHFVLRNMFSIERHVEIWVRWWVTRKQQCFLKIVLWNLNFEHLSGDDIPYYIRSKNIDIELDQSQILWKSCQNWRRYELEKSLVLICEFSKILQTHQSIGDRACRRLAVAI